MSVDLWFIMRQWLWLEGVDEADCCLGGAEIVVVAVGIDFLAAVGAAVDVIAGIDPADADFGLEVPAAVENP